MKTNRRNKMTHKIYFEIDKNVSMYVLYNITQYFGLPEMTIDEDDVIGFFLDLEKDDAEYLMDQFGRYFVTTMDFDQSEKDGNYLCPLA